MNKKILIVALMPFILNLNCLFNNENSAGNNSLSSGMFQNTIIYTRIGEESRNGPNRYICELHMIKDGVDSTLFKTDSTHRSDGCVSSDGKKIVYTKGISPSTKIGAMISAVANDPPHSILITEDGVSEKELVSSEDYVFIQPLFSPSGNHVVVKAVKNNSFELQLYDTTGVKVYSLPFQAGFNAFWISQSILGYKKENVGGQTTVVGIINTNSFQNSEIQLPSDIKGEIQLPNTDSICYKFTDGYYFLDCQNKVFIKTNKFSDIDQFGIIAVKNDSALVMKSSQYHALFISDMNGQIIDSVNITIPFNGFAAQNLWDSYYVTAETGNDQQNIYEISFHDKTMEKITNSGENMFIGTTSDNLD